MYICRQCKCGWHCLQPQARNRTKLERIIWRPSPASPPPLGCRPGLRLCCRHSHRSILLRGMGLPSNPLEGCREYVAQQTCGVSIAGSPVSTEPGDTPKDRCCQELDEAPQHCREAVRYFRAEEPQRDFAKVLVTPGQCNVLTVHNAPYCLGLDI
ncbi:hypothetical protein ZWY2020_005834 [Hordeum vulgare]|nr:hypothetical protein ZWY2020_005834 [Hordeum vulgare]